MAVFPPAEHLTTLSGARYYPPTAALPQRGTSIGLKRVSGSSSPWCPKKPSFTFIDLFAGIGGMRIAFEKAGGDCVFSSEWDASAQKTYIANFGDVPQGDITKIEADQIPEHSVLVAGFPCQPFSIAGVSKKNSLGRAHGFKDETQGTLFFDVLRILTHHLPDAFVLENVKNLRSHNGGHTYSVIIAKLRAMGYHIFDKVIDAKPYVPQHRERIFIVGFKEFRSFDFPTTPTTTHTLSEVLESKPNPKYFLSQKLWQYLANYAKKHQAKGNGFGCTVTPKSGVARTLSARYYKDGSEILVDEGMAIPRRLTPRECANIMGFPKQFKIVVADTPAYKQFGNSVVVPVAHSVAAKVVQALMTSKASRVETEAYPIPARHPKQTAAQSSA